MKFLTFSDAFRLFIINSFQKSFYERIGYTTEYNKVQYRFRIIDKRFFEVDKGNYKFLGFSLDQRVETDEELKEVLNRIDYTQHRYTQLTLGRFEYLLSDFLVQLPMRKTTLEEGFLNGEVEGSLFDFTILMTKCKSGYVTCVSYAGDVILSTQHSQIELDSIQKKAQKYLDCFYRLS